MAQRAFAQALSSCLGREPGSAISSDPVHGERDPVDGAGATDEAKCDGELELLSSQTLSGRPSLSAEEELSRPKKRKLTQAEKDQKRKGSERRKLSKAKANAKYQRSEKKKLTGEELEKTEKCKEQRKERENTDKRKVSRVKFEKTEKRKVSRRLHDGSFGRKSQRSKLRTTPVGQQQQSQEKRTFRCASEQDKVSQQSKEVNRSQYARACRGSEVVSEEGSWTTAARVIAQAESVDLPGSASIMPPSFTALNNDACLLHIKQMYDFLQMASWQTCVVCWRAW